MRILTWNVNGRASKPTWDYITCVLQVDVAFLQEAPPQTRPELATWLWSEIGENSRFGAEGKYPWASGMGAPSAKLEPLTFEALGAGWVVGARHQADGLNLTLINAHVQFRKDGYSTTTLHEIIDAVEPLLKNGDVAFGGDLNVDSLWDDVYGTTRHREVLKRLSDIGLFHVNSLLPAGTRTNRVSKHPYQIDHFFVSQSLRNDVTDVRVIVGSQVAALSDHYPVLLDLVLPND